MSAVSKVIARAILKMQMPELRELMVEVAKEFDLDISIPPEIPHGYVLVPREMSGVMVWAAMDHTWTAHTADANIRAMWKHILEVVPK